MVNLNGTVVKPKPPIMHLIENKFVQTQKRNSSGELPVPAEIEQHHSAHYAKLL